MTQFLRSLLRVRFLWLPVVGLLFGVVLGGMELLAVAGSAGVVAAGFLTVAAVLAVGLVYRIAG